MGGDTTTIFFDPGEREIDARGDAGGRVDVLVLHPKLWRADLDARVALGELAAEAPSDGFGGKCRALGAICFGIAGSLRE